MASLHFIVEAVASHGDAADAEPKRVAIQVEVEGSAPIKSQTELLRATRAIAGEQIQRAIGTETLGELTVAQTKRFEKQGEPLTSADWPGTLVWRVCPPAALAA
jgi:hypothetical protein